MRVRTGVVALSGVVALAAALVLPRIDTMAWFGVGTTDEGTTAVAQRLLDAEGETPGEKVVVELVKGAKPAGLKAGKVSATVSDPYGLACLDPMAWASARTRGLTSDEGDARVTALVYPAGGGGAAYQQVAEAARTCGQGAQENGYGVEGLDWVKGTSAVRVIRRGDVLAVVSVSPVKLMPDEEWTTGVDDRMTALVAVGCLDPEAPAADALRNPFIDAETFTGRTVPEEVPFPEVELTRAEDVATDPVVPLDQTPPALPEAVERPAPLDPAPTSLPDLPAEVARPEAPVAPKSPDLEGSVDRAIADPDGPGCGWAYTGQAAPEFNEATAERSHERAVTAERKRLVEAAVAFEQAKVNFYRAWSEHLVAAAEYKTYAAEVSTVLSQWQVVVDERAAFVTAFEEYRASVRANEQFLERQAEARTSYETANQRCVELSPLELLLSDSGCPAERPAILDETAPPVLPRPVASAEAQLPADWEPPASE